MADRNGYIGRAPADSSVTVARQTFTPTGVTTAFTFSSGYVPGYFDIYINGVKQIEASDYTSTDGSTFSVLNGGAQSGDVIEAVAYKAFNAATVSNASNLTVSGNLTVNGTSSFLEQEHQLLLQLQHLILLIHLQKINNLHCCKQCNRNCCNIYW